jgi:hypothetical protein
MTFHQRLMIIAALAAIVAALLARTPVPGTAAGGPRSGHRVISAFLGLVIVALVTVGIVSETLLRHVIQIVPLVTALSLLAGRPAWGVSAAALLFAFWLFIMGAIWLFLLGIARIVSGTFTPIEVVLTVIIGAACLLGLGATFRQGTTLRVVPRLATIAVFALLQVAAMLLSVQPSVARG